MSLISWGSQVKGPSCPLCKAPCDFITRQEVSSSGKLDETVVVVGKKEIGSSTRSQRTIVLVSLVSEKMRLSDNGYCFHAESSLLVLFFPAYIRYVNWLHLY